MQFTWMRRSASSMAEPTVARDRRRSPVPIIHATEICLAGDRSGMQGNRCSPCFPGKSGSTVMDRGIGSRAQDAQDTLGFVAEAVHLRSGEELNPRAVVIRATAHLIRVPEAARLTGLPRSLLRKSFMSEDKRPKNVPPPPPHKRIGRAVYILASELPVPSGMAAPPKRLPRPTSVPKCAKKYLSSRGRFRIIDLIGAGEGNRTLV
jgi:hypothetical protein